MEINFFVCDYDFRSGAIGVPGSYYYFVFSEFRVKYAEEIRFLIRFAFYCLLGGGKAGFCYKNRFFKNDQFFASNSKIHAFFGKFEFLFLF